MPNSRGVVEFYYTKNLPAGAVAIAQVSVPEMTPAQLTSVNNSGYAPTVLGVWFPTTQEPLTWRGTNTAPDLLATDINQTISFTGQSTLQLTNRYFEITDHAAADGTPLYYMHAVGAEISDVRVFGLNGSQVTTSILVENSTVYHDLGSGAYTVRTVDTNGIVTTTMLRRVPVISSGVWAPSATTYLLTGQTLELFSNGTYYLRFTQSSGFMIMPPYGQPSNVPWFCRIRFGLDQPLQDWLRQPFLPQRPYLLASWVPGTVLASDTVQFERPYMYDNPIRRPDILIFDSNNVLKYALDGTPVNTPRERGTFYPWQRGKINSVDGTSAMAQVAVSLASDDIVWGFYPYAEQDVLYTAVDCNPFTNPDVTRRFVRFYYRTDSDPMRSLYHQIIDPVSGSVAGLTNDTLPVTNWSAADIHVIGDVMVGVTVGSDQFEINDIRQRGGGVDPQYLGTPQTFNLWDNCCWDGKPYPTGASLAVYLPSTILDSQTSDTVTALVQAVAPLGVLPVVHFVDPTTGEEI
jgi:hypothetical protein